jgi:hypothetical protein
MSHPLSDESFTVVPDGVAAFADELSCLSAELSRDVEQIRSAAAWFPSALGYDGSVPGATATSWAFLGDLVASRTRALAGVFNEAVAAYLAEDAALAGSFGPGRAPR